MSYYEKASEIYNMLAQGKLLDAFDKFYHADVVMTEASGAVRSGKAVNRKYEEDFLGMVKEFHGSGVKSICSDEKNGVTTVESWMDITFKDGNRVKMEQVAVQRWKDDQVINERFYYNMPK